jgi:hypothetical protein
MDFYMYKATCPRWYGWHNDIRHVVVEKGTPEETVTNTAQKISNAMTGSNTCDIQLLQKYHMVIEAKKSYPALTVLRFHDTVIKGNVQNLESSKDDIDSC